MPARRRAMRPIRRASSPIDITTTVESHVAARSLCSSERAGACVVESHVAAPCVLTRRRPSGRRVLVRRVCSRHFSRHLGNCPRRRAHGRARLSTPLSRTLGLPIKEGVQLLRLGAVRHFFICASGRRPGDIPRPFPVRILIKPQTHPGSCHRRAPRPA